MDVKALKKNFSKLGLVVKNPKQSEEKFITALNKGDFSIQHIKKDIENKYRRDIPTKCLHHLATLIQSDLESLTCELPSEKDLISFIGSLLSVAYTKDGENKDIVYDFAKFCILKVPNEKQWKDGDYQTNIKIGIDINK